MTPAQRKYDQDLAASMRQLALRIVGRSRKISDTLKVAADRLDALSSAVPVEPQSGDTIETNWEAQRQLDNK